VHSVCPYCAMGCSQLVSVKGGKVIDIEGNPDSPINEGTLCPKGANTFQLAVNPHRVTKVLYRAPYSTQWKQRPLEWSMGSPVNRRLPPSNNPADLGGRVGWKRAVSRAV